MRSEHVTLIIDDPCFPADRTMVGTRRQYVQQLAGVGLRHNRRLFIGTTAKARQQAAERWVRMNRARQRLMPTPASCQCFCGIV